MREIYSMMSMILMNRLHKRQLFRRGEMTGAGCAVWSLKSFSNKAKLVVCGGWWARYWLAHDGVDCSS